MKIGSYKRYVFTEANRQFKLQSGDLPLSYFSWGVARLLLERGVVPYC